MLKGPVLGPMVLCGICYFKSTLLSLSEIGVKDSKKLSPKKRSELAEVLKRDCYSYKIVVVNSQEIDNRKTKRITLNQLEELKMAVIINNLKPDIIYIDAADVNEKRFGNSIKRLLHYNPKKIISEHKADDTYPIVSAASIIAKDRRDSIIEELKVTYGNFGSGYPSDPITIRFLKDFLKKHKRSPIIARKTWETTKRMIDEELNYRKITDFLN